MATVVKRVFNLSTRTLKSPSGKCYVGQVYDHISTTLEFTYDPINALTDGYVPYIVFNLYDDQGNLFVYGPGSSPRFDGYVFEIPTAVTSRIKSTRLDYQIWLIRNRTEWDGRIETLGDTEYLFSAMDSLAFKDGLRCRQPSRNPCSPPQPCLEPGTLGWVNYLRDHCVLTPVQEFYGILSDGADGVSLLFPTYNESKDCTVELRIPYLNTSGKVDIHKHLPMVSKWKDATKFSLVDALMVKDALAAKVDDTQIITSWDSLDRNLVGQELQLASATLSRATFDKLDEKKTDKTMSVAHYDGNAVYNVGSVVIWTDGRYAPDMYICMKDGTQGVDPKDRSVWSCVSEQNMILDEWGMEKAEWEEYKDNPAITMSARNLRLHSIPPWSEHIEYECDSVVLYDNTMFISQRGGNSNNRPFRPDTTAKSVDEEWWVPVRGSGDLAEKDFSTVHTPLKPCDYAGGADGPVSCNFREDLGGWVIRHPFYTYNVFVQVRLNVIGDEESGKATCRRLVYADIEPRSPSEVLVKLDQTHLELDEETKRPTGWPIDDMMVYISPGGGRDAGKTGMEGFQLTSEKGVAGGYAGLAASTDDKIGTMSGTVPATQLPMMTSWNEAKRYNIAPADMVRNAVDYNTREIGYCTKKVDFGRWSAESMYTQGAVVTHAGRMYIAQRDGLKGLDPSTVTDGSWLAFALADNSDDVSRFVLTTSVEGTELVAEHGLNTRNILYSIRSMSDNRFLRDYDVYADSDDTARFVFPSSPGMVTISILSCPAPPMDSVEEVRFEGVNPWVYENTTGAPLFVQSIMDSGDLGFAIVNQDPATEYDPVTVKVMASVPDGTLVAGKADFVRRFTKEDLEQDSSSKEWVLTIPKSEVSSEIAWYAVQVYLDKSGQAMANIKQSGSTITVGISDKTIQNMPDISGAVVLKRATSAVNFEMGDIIEGVLTVTIPEKRGVAGVQLFLGAEGDMMLSDVKCIDGKVTARFSEDNFGTVVLI